MLRRLLVIAAALRFACGAAYPAEVLTDPAAIEKALAPIAERARRSEAREIAFDERRHFPFRKQAVETRGVARIDETLGISIAYPKEGRALIIDDRGLTLRKLESDGRSRDRRARGGDAELPQLLDALFRFDLAALSQRFDMALEPSEERGRALILTPKDDSEGRIERIRAELSEERPTRFLIELGGDRRIEIEPLEERELERFDDETARRYFNAP